MHIGYWLEKTEGKRSLGKPRQRGENNIEIKLQEIGGGVDWMGTGLGLVEAVMKLRSP